MGGWRLAPAGKHTDNLAAPRLHVAPSPQPSDHTLQAPTMKFLLLSLLSLTYAQNAPCPTITSRTSICSTCVQPLCLAISTVTPGRGCPGGCGGTQWVTATATACQEEPTECEDK